MVRHLVIVYEVYEVYECKKNYNFFLYKSKVKHRLSSSNVPVTVIIVIAAVVARYSVSITTPAINIQGNNTPAVNISAINVPMQRGVR